MSQADTTSGWRGQPHGLFLSPRPETKSSYLSLVAHDRGYLILSGRALHDGKEVLAILLLERAGKRRMGYCWFLSDFPYVKVKKHCPIISYTIQ